MYVAIGIEETHKVIKNIPDFHGLIKITPNDVVDIKRLNKALWKLEAQEIRPMDTEEDVPPLESLTYNDYLIHDPYYESVLNTYRVIMIDGLIIRNTENGVFGYEPEGRQNFEANYETTIFNDALSNVYTSDDMNGLIDMPVVLPENLFN